MTLRNKESYYLQEKANFHNKETPEQKDFVAKAQIPPNLSFLCIKFDLLFCRLRRNFVLHSPNFLSSLLSEPINFLSTLAVPEMKLDELFSIRSCFSNIFPS